MKDRIGSDINVMITLTTVDQLMFLIQQVTGAPTDEILGFFNDLGRSVVEIGIKNMKSGQRSIRKTISDYFPDSSIPFQIMVTGHKVNNMYDHQNKVWTEKTGFNADVQVGFPDSVTRQNNDKLMEIIAEKALLGGSSLPPFEKPPTKTPKMYKTLMKNLYDLHKKEQSENLCDTGHSRSTGSAE